MFKQALAFFLLAATALAQVVTVSTPRDFDGWIRTTTDWQAMPPAVDCGDALVVRGRRLGLELWSLDVRVKLAAGDALRLNLAKGRGTKWVLPQPATAGLSFPVVNGKPLPLRSATADGAGWLVHFAGRCGHLLHADVWVVHYPTLPGLARGELVVTASNPQVAATSERLAAPLTLTLQGATVSVPGGSAVLLPAGTTIADGQARSWPFAAVWPAVVQDWQWPSVDSVFDVSACGLSQTWRGWTPAFAGDAAAWAAQHRASELRHLQGWTAGLGVAPRSGVTGAQEDQLFPGGEAALAAEAVFPRYLAALGQSRRPCHHLEAGGSLLALADHPKLVLWEGRPHWPTTGDRLGKVATLPASGANGWWGPDEEHRLYGSVLAAYRATGSPALQWQLRHAATHLVFEAKGRIGAARAIGYRGMLSVQLWWHLEDRALADAVAVAWHRFATVDLLPTLAKRGDVWDARVDPRLGAGTRWMVWQQGLGAWGAYEAFEQFGPADGKAVALRAAELVVRDAIVRTDAGWRAYYTMQVGGTDHQFGSSDWLTFGTCLAVSLKRRAGPADERTESIWQQIERSGAGKWADPRKF